MAIAIKLSDTLVEQAKHHAHVQHRSVPQQIEYWSSIGKIAEDNPDLPFTLIRQILIADQEDATTDYSFD